MKKKRIFGQVATAALLENEENGIYDDKCPTCGSPDPKKHPAAQFEGEVTVCQDAFHKTQPSNYALEMIEFDADLAMTALSGPGVLAMRDAQGEAVEVPVNMGDDLDEKIQEAFKKLKKKLMEAEEADEKRQAATDLCYCNSDKQGHVPGGIHCFSAYK